MNLIGNPKAPDSHSPVRVATLRGDVKIPFDAYIRIGQKYILYCRKGDSFEGARLERLKSKKLKMMHIRKEDEIPYKQYLESNINAAYDSNSGKSLDIRAEIIQGFQQATAEDYLEDPLHKFSYEHIRSSVQRFCEFLEKEPFALPSILKITNNDESITHHGVNVAALAVSITLNSSLREGNPLHLLALGCLLHDLEHYYVESDMKVPLNNMSKETKEIYRSHPLAGAHRLQGSTFVDQLVLNIITQHEENMDGGGYPKGLFADDMDPLVLVAATANAYDRRVSFEKMTPKDALKDLLIDKMGAFPLVHLQTLQNLLKTHGVV